MITAYVTYDADGKFTGGYIQEIHPDHHQYIIVDSCIAVNWPEYCLIDGEIKKAVIQPGFSSGDYQLIVQEYLDNEARSHGYDGIVSLCGYAAAGNKYKFGREGIAAVEWRCVVWEFCLKLLNDVQNGKVGAPKSKEQFLEMLPKFLWPD